MISFFWYVILLKGILSPRAVHCLLLYNTLSGFIRDTICLDGRTGEASWDEYGYVQSMFSLCVLYVYYLRRYISGIE